MPLSNLSLIIDLKYFGANPKVIRFDVLQKQVTTGCCQLSLDIRINTTSNNDEYKYILTNVSSKMLFKLAKY